MIDRVRERFGAVSACSCDKGFSSKTDIDIMELSEIKAMIPKKGRLNKTDLQRESDPAFIKGKRKHSAIESNINELEHKGLERCPDRGIGGFQRYVGLGT